MARYITAFLLFSLCYGVCAQELPEHGTPFGAETREHWGTYAKFTVKDFFRDRGRWTWSADVYMRRQSPLENNTAILQEPQRLSIRPWVGYQIRKTAGLAVSPIGFFTTQPRYVIDGDEGRPVEREMRSTVEFYTDQLVGNSIFTHRYRLEYRRRDLDGSNVGPYNSLRFRYRIRVRKPLTKDSYYANNVIYAVAYAEAHAEFNTFRNQNYLVQNRNFVGFGIRYWDWARSEIGYIRQYSPRSSQIVDVTNAVMVYFNIDLWSQLRTY
ncbi:MAG: DUF2490 domain-containing protein [Cyclobacteriaceae bacterium]|nr:DUF2490 domain-containing protein [Cyclobacteriaceae bacterium]MCH8515130.1 DUF2490 domain-containing protein [Cyclobacteriaceae bacterium]